MVTRREFLRWCGNSFSAGIFSAGGLLLYSRYVEPSVLTVRRIKVEIAGLPPSLEGFRIAHLTDFHVDPYFPLDLFRRAVDTANRLQPQIVVLTGDYITSNRKSMRRLASVLAALRPELGTFAVLGNHDRWWGGPDVHDGLGQAGAHVMVNAGASLRWQGGDLWLAGLDDMWAGRPDLNRATQGCPPKVPVISLAHAPEFADRAAEDERIILQLSGHSHGGQVRLPAIGPVILPQFGRRYDLGIYQVGKLFQFTNPGIGVIDPPVRLNCPPELALLTLTGQIQSA
jgi:hypothetical protein